MKKISFVAMLCITALSVGTKAFGQEEAMAESAAAAPAPFAFSEVQPIAAAEPASAPVAEPVEFAVAIQEEDSYEEAIAVAEIAEPVAEEPTYTPAPVASPATTDVSNTRIVANSDAMSHEVIALTKLQEQHNQADAAREAQYRYTMAREAGMYFEPRIFGAKQEQPEVDASEIVTKTKTPKSKSSSDDGKDKRYGSGAGIKGGMLVSQFDMNYKGSPMKIGYTAGLFAEYILKNNIGFGAEVNFTQVSAQTYYNENSFTGNFNKIETTKLNYVTVPLLLKYNKVFAQGLAIEAGIQLGFLVGGSVKTEYPTYKESASLSTDYNTFDLGLPIGLSYTFKHGLTLGARYVLGLSTTLESKNYKNRAASITVGYRF